MNGKIPTDGEKIFQLIEKKIYIYIYIYLAKENGVYVLGRNLVEKHDCCPFHVFHLKFLIPLLQLKKLNK